MEISEPTYCSGVLVADRKLDGNLGKNFCSCCVPRSIKLIIFLISEKQRISGSRRVFFKQSYLPREVLKRNLE